MKENFDSERPLLLSLPDLSLLLIGFSLVDCTSRVVDYTL